MSAYNRKLWYWMLLLVIFTVVSRWQHYAKADDDDEQLVPCYFIFGDSLADNGNNNMLQTLAKVDYSPYGIDFPGGPTGRFCNGRTLVDIIAQFLGFRLNQIPPFATCNGTGDILSGVNYASGAAGIRNETGQELGDRISFNMQLENHGKTVLNLINILGNESAAAHLNKCLYSVGMGSNDYLNNYFLPMYFPTSKDYTLDQYTELLIQQYTQQIRTLYGYGARKVVLFGLGKIGCTPGTVDAHGTNGSACVELINHASQLFNSKLILVVDQLNDDLPDAKFIYINNYKMGDDATMLDFKVNTTGCCASNTVGQCILNDIPCQNRTEYAFWDSYHPTETLNIFYAERSYIALNPSYAHPFDIRHLVFLHDGVAAI